MFGVTRGTSKAHLCRGRAHCEARGHDCVPACPEDAIRESARAVSLLMEYIREAMNKDASDSAIEL